MLTERLIMEVRRNFKQCVRSFCFLPLLTRLNTERARGHVGQALPQEAGEQVLLHLLGRIASEHKYESHTIADVGFNETRLLFGRRGFRSDLHVTPTLAEA